MDTSASKKLSDAVRDIADDTSGMQVQKAQEALYLHWDVIERSQGGNERRRRLAWRMTEAQAWQWQADNGGKLERVDEAMARMNFTNRAHRIGRPGRG